jgi:hypothetical protein
MSEGTAAPAALRVIRVALLAGVVIFGTVVFYMTREGPISDAPSEAGRYLSFVLMGLSAASLAALVVVRSLREKASDWERKSSLTVIGWALGEGPGLLGGVIWMVTASPVPYLIGLAVLLVSFLMIPIPEAP